MPTQNPRLNVVLEKPLYQMITKLAKKEGISVSLKTRDLIREALELGEDLYWGKKATERSKTFKARSAISHANIWK